MSPVPVSAPPLMALLRDLTRRAEGELFDRLKESGFPDLRPSHSALLTTLEPAGARVTELAARAAVSPQTMGETIDDLERRGYLTRQADPSDRRARLVIFTARGLAAVQECLAIVEDIEAALVAAVGEPDYRQLRSTVEAIASTPDVFERPGRSRQENERGVPSARAAANDSRTHSS